MNDDNIFEINSLNDFVGNKLVFEQIYNSVENIEDSNKILIIGPSGVGKTKYVEYLCNHFKYDYIKLDSSLCQNAKDFIDRLEKLYNWKDISSIINGINRRIIIIDELETLIKIDRNIPSNLVKFWKEQKKNLPFIIIGQYDADKKISELRKQCSNIYYLKPLDDTDLFLYLKTKIPKKLIKLSDLMTIVENSNGSIYSAIQSIQSYINDKKIINYGKDSFLDIKHIFTYQDYNDIYSILYEDPWIYPLNLLENATKVYNNKNYKYFISDYVLYEQMINDKNIDSYDIPIGYLSQMLYIRRNIKDKGKTKKLDEIQFTKLLSYISTQKKIQRVVYDKIDKKLPISDIGIYWIHKYLLSK
jgi:DNA polymerase III delta prime subunit